MAGLVSDFLDGLTYGGKGLLEGSADPLGGKGVGSLTDRELTQNNAPFLFAKLLQQASQPGGFLSDASLSDEFAGIASAQASTFGAQQADLAADLEAQGVNPAFAQGVLGENRSDARSALLSLRARLQAEREGRQFDAVSALANVTADAAAQTKTNELQLRMFEEAQRNARRAGNLGFLGNLLSAGISLIPGGGAAAPALSFALNNFGSSGGGGGQVYGPPSPPSASAFNPFGASTAMSFAGFNSI